MSIKDLSSGQQEEYFNMKHVLLVIDDVIGNYTRRLDGIDNRSHGYTVKLQCIRLDTNKCTTVYQYKYAEYFLINNDMHYVKNETLCIPISDMGDSCRDEKYIISCFGITSFGQCESENYNKESDIIIYDNSKPIDSPNHVRRTVISLKKHNTNIYTYRRTEEIDGKVIVEEKYLVHESPTLLTNEQLVEMFKKLSLQATAPEKPDNKMFDELRDL
jgi:hypothetical protein